MTDSAAADYLYRAWVIPRQGRSPRQIARKIGINVYAVASPRGLTASDQPLAAP